MFLLLVSTTYNTIYSLWYNNGMPYHVGEKGSYGCSGYPAVDAEGTVMGCHNTAEEAANQIYAINVSEGNIEGDKS